MSHGVVARPNAVACHAGALESLPLFMYPRKYCIPQPSQHGQLEFNTAGSICPMGTRRCCDVESTSMANGVDSMTQLCRVPSSSSTVSPRINVHALIFDCT